MTTNTQRYTLVKQLILTMEVITSGGLVMTALNSLDMFPDQQYKLI